MTTAALLNSAIEQPLLGADSLLVVTPWYPSPGDSYSGAFVLQTVRALAPHYREITVLHVQHVAADDDRPPSWEHTPEGPVLRVRVPTPASTSRVDMMRLQREAMRTHALDLIRSASVVHCHVGAPTGAGLAELLAPSTRLVLTEHASYLPQVLRTAEARELYRAAVQRAEVVTAVGERTATVIESVLPGPAGRVAVVPNPVPLDTFPLRPDLPVALSRWLFVGNLVRLKGVTRLLRVFAAWVAEVDDDAARLTVVGQGVQQAELAVLAGQLGIADRVRFAGVVEPHRIAEVYRDHDVLVHLSEIETFGLTCIEAAASGLPVLATASGGPQGTLAVHAAFGLAQVVPVAGETATAEVVQAMHRLQAAVARATQDDVSASRVHLERCYGASAIGAVLHAALTGATDPSPARATDAGPTERTGPSRPLRVLGLAVLPAHTRPVEQVLREVAGLGGTGMYLTMQPVRSPVPGSIEVIDRSAIERRTLTSWLERAVVLRVPGQALRLLGRAARLVDAVTRPAGAGRPRLQAWVAALQEQHRGFARRMRNGPYAAFWRHLGPWYVARRLERDGTLDALLLEEFDGIVVADDFGVPLAVRLLRRRPELELYRRCTREDMAGVYTARVRRATGRGPR